MYGHQDKTGKSHSKGESKSLIREEREKEEEASERLIWIPKEKKSKSMGRSINQSHLDKREEESSDWALIAS